MFFKELTNSSGLRKLIPRGNSIKTLNGETKFKFKLKKGRDEPGE